MTITGIQTHRSKTAVKKLLVKQNSSNACRLLSSIQHVTDRMYLLLHLTYQLPLEKNSWAIAILLLGNGKEEINAIIRLCKTDCVYSSASLAKR